MNKNIIHECAADIAEVISTNISLNASDYSFPAQLTMVICAMNVVIANMAAAVADPEKDPESLNKSFDIFKEAMIGELNSTALELDENNTLIIKSKK